jgi:hypothetical protein
VDIYIKLKDYEQSELLDMLPCNNRIAVQIKAEQQNARTRAFRLTHEQIDKDVRTYVDEGGVIHFLPPDPKLTAARRERARMLEKKAVGPERPKLSSALRGVDKNLLIAMLQKELQRANL